MACHFWFFATLTLFLAASPHIYSQLYCQAAARARFRRQRFPPTLCDFRWIICSPSEPTTYFKGAMRTVQGVQSRELTTSRSVLCILPSEVRSGHHLLVVPKRLSSIFVLQKRIPKYLHPPSLRTVIFKKLCGKMHII